MTELSFFADLCVAALLLIGAFFTLVGSIGLLKLDNPISRLHAPTVSATLGVGGVLMASVINAFATGDGSLHETLVMAFLFVTAPITANFIAKVHMHRQRNTEAMVPPPEAGTWATYTDD